MRQNGERPPVPQRTRSGTTLNTTERYLHAIRASEFADAATRALTPRPEQARTLAAVPVEPAARSSSGRTSEAHPPNNPCPPKWGTPFHHCGTISRHSRMAAARRHAQPPQAPLSRRREGQRWAKASGASAANRSYCQMLWMRGRENAQAATFSSVVAWSLVSSLVTRMPSVNLASSRTSATSSWPLKRRQRCWAASSSL